MFDQILTLALQHYVIFGLLALAAGVLFNLAFMARSEVMNTPHLHKLY